MNNVDYSKVPEGAQYYANKAWWKANDVKCGWLVFDDGVWLCAESTITFANSPFFYNDVISRAHITDANEKAWPESEERVDIIGTNGGDGMHYDEFREEEEAPALKLRPTYNRDIIGLDGAKTTVDVYRVLDAFKTESSAIDHAVKKLLCAGIRHQKDRKQDLEEAIKSIQAELLLMSQR